MFTYLLIKSNSSTSIEFAPAILLSMLDHHLQRAMVYQLALADSLRFSELKPAEVENKLFDYHLKKVVAAGYIVKKADGSYSLTPEGRRLGVHVLSNVQALVDRAYSVLLLVIRRSNGDWLLYRRKNQPLLGKVGFMHATPTADELIVKTAARECLQRTGLKAEFTVCGSGYFRVYYKDTLESFTHFTLLEAKNVSGELVVNDELADYFWTPDPLSSADDLLPNMPLLLANYQKQQPFFIDEQLRL